jgi:hypothetical protein
VSTLLLPVPITVIVLCVILLRVIPGRAAFLELIVYIVESVTGTVVP